MKKATMIPARFLALVLWIITTVFALVEIYLIRQTVLRIYVRLGSDYSSGILIGNSVVFVLALLWLVFAIATGEYHLRRVGQPGSWKLFGWSIVIELIILIIYFIV